MNKARAAPKQDPTLDWATVCTSAAPLLSVNEATSIDVGSPIESNVTSKRRDSWATKLNTRNLSPLITG
ncbi:MAG: hypothetical protein NVS3B3_13860 [Aquirhabdus sp.]